MLSLHASRRKVVDSRNKNEDKSTSYDKSLSNCNNTIVTRKMVTFLFHQKISTDKKQIYERNKAFLSIDSDISSYSFTFSVTNISQCYTYPPRDKNGFTNMLHM